MKRLFTLLLVIMGMVTTASAYYSLPGTWDSWKKDTHQFSGNTVTINLNGNTTYKFKFYNSEGDSWSGNTTENATMKYNDCSGWWFNGDKEVQIETTITGDYTFTLSWVGDGGTTPCISVTYPTTYTRTVIAGNYGTICLPYNATISGADVYQIYSVDGEFSNLSGINISSIDSRNIVRGYSYIFKATSSTLTATLEDGTYSNVVHEKSDGMTGNLSNDPLTLDGSNSYCYVIKDNTVRKVVKPDEEHNATVTVGQYRAYIDLTGFSNPPAPALNTEFIPFYDDAPSSINAVQVSDSKANEYFNLNGQRVAQPTKGLYIVNGKKVVLK